jgi:uncharacterized protein YjbI with pentapeptide repeats
MESSTVKPTAAQSTSTSTDATPVAKDMKHAGLQELCGKRDAGAILPTAGAPLQLAGLRLVEANLSELDLSGADLSGAELLNCDFTGSRLVGANLTDAVLHNADMTNVELLGSDISRADFTNSTLHKAGLGTVTAHETVFFGATCHEATFSGADMTGCDLRAAKLDGARMIKTNLDKSVCTNAVLSNVDMTSTSVHDASFHDAALHGASLRGVSGYKSADWIGADIQNHEFRTQSKKHEVLYRVWSITSDCGRSLARWSLWTVLVALIYAYLYTLVDIDWGDYETPLSPVYYSVVTFTTLGYGDVLPGSVGAQVMAMSEVVLGYFSLGGMMSILSDKMARRAG